MGKIIGKKGIFFTFIAITMMTIFILVFTPQIDLSLQKDAQSLNTRINTIDSYINELEEGYLKAVLRATTYKTLLSLAYYIDSTDSYLTNFDAAFQEVFVNGTINKVQIDSITNRQIMHDNAFTNWSNKTIKLALETLKIDTKIMVKDVSAVQTSPWEIDLTLKINLSVKSNVAEWNKISTIKTTLPVEGLYDPYYHVNTNGLYAKKVKNADILFNQWNVTYVRYNIRNGTYVYWTNANAPNYLSRFTGAFTPSACCGIESFVNPNLITPSDRIKSYVDYILFDPASSIPCNLLYNITNPATGGGIWDEFRYFKLDFEHLTKYNITSNDAVRTLIDGC